MSTRTVQAQNLNEGDRIFVNGEWVTVVTVGTFTTITYTRADEDFPNVAVQEQVDLEPRQLIKKQS